jgi:hypothetical protein
MANEQRYIIVHNKDREALSQEVNDMLSRDWRPLGGIAIGKDGFYQTMLNEHDAAKGPSKGDVLA